MYFVHKQTKYDFIFIPGKMIWSTKDLDESILCLLWVAPDADHTEPELLVSGGSDKRLRIWKREKGEDGTMEGLKMSGMFGGQPGVVLALAQNSTYLATASGKGHRCFPHGFQATP